ncbi:hypothetical protein ACLKA6_018030 [Drosophila palustris]
MISAMDNFDNRSYGAISKGRSEFSMPELTPEQQKLLIELRRKKQELLLEIQYSMGYLTWANDTSERNPRNDPSTLILSCLSCSPCFFGYLCSRSPQCINNQNSLPSSAA